MKTAPPDVSTAEKDFYLKEFRGKSLLFALRAKNITAPKNRDVVQEVLRTLVLNETRMILLVETDASTPERQAVGELHTQLSHTLSGIPAPVLLSPESDENQRCLIILETLRTVPVFIGLWPAQARLPALQNTQQLANRLTVYKLVILDPQGGLTANGAPLSFLNGSHLEELQTHGARGELPHERHRQLETVRLALEGGVASVSLCSPANLAKELFTYEGCGTFFTLTDYCQAERLALDDFHEAEQLIQRGEQEGALKKRSPSEISQLLLHGYGARLGKERDLVGLCALLPYADDNAGEIAGLYTLRRFHGEGIGSRLVGKAITEGQARGLTYLFACTNQEGARRLFERFEFRQVTPDAVPAKKWHAYAPERKRAVSVYRRILS
jgi:N-acetylglutamate synthase-like GNAT family acetyltransferase